MTGWLAAPLARWLGDARAAFDLVEAASVVGLVWVFRAHVTALVTTPDADASQRAAARRFGVLASPLVAAMIPLQYVLLGEVMGLRRYVYFPWDLPGALGFMLCVSLLRARRWSVYYPCFVLATLTRETTYFLPVLHLLHAPDDEGPRRIALHVAAQAALWVAVKLALRWIYRHNPGDGAWVDTFDDNVALLGDFGSLSRVLGCFAFLWVPAVVFARSIPDRFTRRALWVMPMWFVGMLRVGNLYELRVFGELMAIVLPAWLLALRAAARDAP